MASKPEDPPVLVPADRAVVEETSIESSVAEISAAASATVSSSSGDEAPWPTDETAESAFLAATIEKAGVVATPVVAAVPREDNDDAPVQLPSMDALMQRIPVGVRETLEDLFRAKFTAVRRVPEKYLNKS